MPDTKSLITNLLPFVAIIVFFYFAILRPQKKKDKAISSMRENIKPGDKIITIGGFVCRVVSVKEDSLIVESTGDNTKLEIMKWGVNSVIGGSNETH